MRPEGEAEAGGQGRSHQVQIKLSIQRLRTLQEKKLALAKKSRREIADLVQKGRTETAKLRVEGLIQDDIYVELLELLEVGNGVRCRLGWEVRRVAARRWSGRPFQQISWSTGLRKEPDA